jgi:hypothetical protein
VFLEGAEAQCERVRSQSFEAARVADSGYALASARSKALSDDIDAKRLPTEHYLTRNASVRVSDHLHWHSEKR